MGVAIDGAGRDLVLMGDVVHAVPVNEGLFDAIALRVVADEAVALVTGEVGGAFSRGGRSGGSGGNASFVVHVRSFAGRKKNPTHVNIIVMICQWESGGPPTPRLRRGKQAGRGVSEAL